VIRDNLQLKIKDMKKLDLSIGILGWKSGKILRDTLSSYEKNGLLNMVSDVKILFQEITDEDIKIADEFNLPFIGLETNIGIGKGFIKLAKSCKSENILLLEHDWKLIESPRITHDRLLKGIDLLDSGYSVVRYRHRESPGHPHYSFVYKGNELNFYDESSGLISTHLIDSLHWLDPSLEFPDKIEKNGEFFVTTSRWASWTNNPCIYKKHFYLYAVNGFSGEGIELERLISRWWPNQNYRVAHSEGLFMHSA